MRPEQEEEQEEQEREEKEAGFDILQHWESAGNLRSKDGQTW